MKIATIKRFRTISRKEVARATAQLEEVRPIASAFLVGMIQETIDAHQEVVDAADATLRRLGAE